MKDFIKKLSYDKIKINNNKRPIKMSLFLSFLNIELKRSKSHLGSSNGWTMLYSEDKKLIIKGGIVSGTEYLTSIEYEMKLHNSFNNYVNPFFIFHLITEEGHDFFKDYYKEDILKIIKDSELSIDNKTQDIIYLQDLINKAKNLKVK